ncbi:actin-like ATPase domain-containing protein [Sporormia fimetaria CBS 119925]|uniref:Actin-like ATPase domain-containing protein n=1 Tax=Sporormia fimetaria CBS 119925 TaxID=1340428 RepID=A0A6A6V4I1_9PLEO|nr:actin-like ATPase domain-containing protein [Sporormia fimetaria CBS 119925]
MVGKKSGRAQLREEGLARTDNNLDLTTWPQVNMINQKNYYTEFLKREEQFLAFRAPAEEATARMVQAARDKDRALAFGATPETGEQGEEDATDDPAALSSDADPSKLVIIHPGSQNLRIGFGTDALPKTVPMVIARRWKQAECEEGDGEPSPKRQKVEDSVPASALPEKWFGEDFANQYQAMCSELRTRMRNNKMRVLPNNKELVVNWNRRQQPKYVDEHNDSNQVDWTEIPASAKEAPDFFTGHQALRIPELSNPRYKLFWPVQNGVFNERDYTSRNQLYHDISKILEEALKSQLGIAKVKDLANHRCVFIIPDLYERNYVTMLLDILIRDLGFGKVCLQQESLSATFGAGTGAACVVDIGAQKTSICCVDEGMCVEDSRINLKMGGWDVTETFIKMMLFDHFPYADINLKRRYDFILAEELKQEHSSMEYGDVYVKLVEFYIRAPGQDTRKWSAKTYDAPWLSAMGLFKPSIFDHSRKLLGFRNVIPRSVDIYDGSPNDPVSGAQQAVMDYASGKSSTQVSTNNLLPASTPSRSQTQTLLSRLNEAEATPRSSVAGSPVPEGTPNPDMDVPGNDTEQPLVFRDPVLEKTKAAAERDKILPVMPLDEAILQSLDYGARGDDRKLRDFFGGIILIGGGSKTRALGTFLEARLRELRPFYGKEILVVPPPREFDPQVIVWKGGSVFGRLSSHGNDSWISRAEYNMLGSRLLTHKCMFAW